MSSLCHSLKTEYDALKKLNAEFVSACEKAGDSRNLSAQQLTELQALKHTLEQKRDAIEKKIENRITKASKEIRKSLLATIYEADGPYQGCSVDEIINEEMFRVNLFNYIDSTAERGQGSGYYGYLAVTGFYAAVGLGLLKKGEEIKIRALMENDVFQRELAKCIFNFSVAGKSSSVDAFRATTTFRVVCKLGFNTTSPNTWSEIERMIRRNNVRKNFTCNIQRGIDSTLGADAWTSIMTFLTAADLKILDEGNIDAIQTSMETEAFRSRFIQRILSDAGEAHLNFDNARVIAICLNSLKELIAQSRKLQS